MDPEREVFLLHRNKLSFPEIAMQLRISVPEAKKLHRSYVAKQRKAEFKKRLNKTKKRRK